MNINVLAFFVLTSKPCTSLTNILYVLKVSHLYRTGLVKIIDACFVTSYRYQVTEIVILENCLNCQDNVRKSCTAQQYMFHVKNTINQHRNALPCELVKIQKCSNNGANHFQTDKKSEKNI